MLSESEIEVWPSIVLIVTPFSSEVVLIKMDLTCSLEEGKFLVHCFLVLLSSGIFIVTH